jgi:hypothetical protein
MDEPKLAVDVAVGPQKRLFGRADFQPNTLFYFFFCLFFDRFFRCFRFLFGGHGSPVTLAENLSIFNIIIFYLIYKVNKSYITSCARVALAVWEMLSLFRDGRERPALKIDLSRRIWYGKNPIFGEV